MASGEMLGFTSFCPTYAGFGLLDAKKDVASFMDDHLLTFNYKPSRVGTKCPRGSRVDN